MLAEHAQTHRSGSKYVMSSKQISLMNTESLNRIEVRSEYDETSGMHLVKDITMLGCNLSQNVQRGVVFFLGNDSTWS